MIVYNAIGCAKCLDVIESIYTHDFKSCKCGRVCVDGGLSYLKRGYQDYTDIIDLSVTTEDDFEIIRQFAFRTGYGKPGNPDYGRLTRLKDMSDDHLEAVLEYVPKGGPHWQLYLEEKLYRNEL